MSELFLINSNGIYKSINVVNEIEDLGTIQPDSSVFENKGMSYYHINKNIELLKTLQAPVELLCWVPLPETYGLELDYDYNEIKPPIVAMEVDEYNQLGDTIKTVSYTDKEYDMEILQTATVESKITYLLSLNNVDWYGYNGSTWVKDYEMSEDQLESIQSIIFQSWMGDSVYKQNLYIKYFVKNQDPDINMVVKNITVEYTPNQPPVIIDPIVTPNEIHAEFATLTATLKDLEGDSLQYRVLIQKNNETEFDIADDWADVPINGVVLRAYNQPYFNVGTNVVKLEVKDQRGLVSEWIGNVIIINENPTSIITYDNFGLDVTVDDVEGDTVSMQISIDDVIIYPFDVLTSTPRNVKYSWDTKYLEFGTTSKILVEFKDSFGGLSSEEFYIVGEYKNILFMDEDDNYYSSDVGVILKTLDIDKITLPDYSEPKLIKLKNNTTYPLKNVTLQANKNNIPSNTIIEFSDTLDPFNPKEIIDFVDVMNHGDVKDVYLRVKATEGRGSDSITATLSSTGSIIY